MRDYRLFILVMLIALMISCKDDLPVLDQNQVIKIEAESSLDNLSADGKTIITVKATIPASAVEAAKNVTFLITSGLGTFQGTTIDSKNTVYADANGIARTKIKLGSNPGTFYISASVTRDNIVYRSEDIPINLNPLNQDQVIKIEAESNLSNLRADGKSIITFKATIPAGTVGIVKNVTFTTTSGLGVFQGTVIDSKNIVQADVNGIAKANIKLGSTPGNFYISASVTWDDVVYRSQDLPVTLTAAEVFDIEASADNLHPEANGFTLITLTATTADFNDKTVELITNLGTFTQSTDPTKVKLPLIKGKATTILRISNKAQPHIVTYTTDLAKTTLLQIQPIISRPEILLVEPSSLITDSIGGGVQFRCYLRKINTDQKVSVGYSVSFRAYQLIDGTQVSVGRFTGTAAAVADAEGNIPPVTFFSDSGNIDTNKDIIVDCYTYKNPTEQLHVLTKIHIKK